MSDFFNKSKKKYQEIKMPETYIDDYFDILIKTANQNKKKYNLLTPVLHFAMAIIIIFSLAVNVSPVFARTMYEIPIISTLAKFVTFRQYNFESTGTVNSINYPHIEGIKDKAVEKKINALIDKTIASFLQEQETYDAIYKDNSDGPKVANEITYQVYYNDANMVSFCLENTQIIASSNSIKKFFTIDLMTGNVYTLDHFLGKDFASIVKKEVSKQVIENTRKDENNKYFMEEIENLQITKEQSFYINKDGKVVICFDKYQIAPGYMSTPEFIIS